MGPQLVPSQGLLSLTRKHAVCWEELGLGQLFPESLLLEKSMNLKGHSVNSRYEIAFLCPSPAVAGIKPRPVPRP